MSIITPIKTHHCGVCGTTLQTSNTEWIDNTLQVFLEPCQKCYGEMEVQIKGAIAALKQKEVYSGDVQYLKNRMDEMMLLLSQT